ncbi:hypothetical protein [Limisphaera sp. VF-2]|uniref:hypothetical protein n=1 Tax=Limisphaera sp. VF-2 TaxID=3400418 RepID=UPI003C1D3B3A
MIKELHENRLAVAFESPGFRRNHLHFSKGCRALVEAGLPVFGIWNLHKPLMKAELGKNGWIPGNCCRLAGMRGAIFSDSNAVFEGEP